MYPFPHSYTYLNGQRLIVLRTHVDSDATDAEPGIVLDASGEAVHVATGHGGRLAIDELQPEGRRPMKTRDFLAGHQVKPGARLTGP